MEASESISYILLVVEATGEKRSTFTIQNCELLARKWLIIIVLRTAKPLGPGIPLCQPPWSGKALLGGLVPPVCQPKKVKLTNISRYMLGLAQATRKQKLVFFCVFLPIGQGGQPSVFGPGIAGQITPAGGQVRVPPSYSRVQALLGRLVPLEKIQS